MAMGNGKCLAVCVSYRQCPGSNAKSEIICASDVFTVKFERKNVNVKVVFQVVTYKIECVICHYCKSGA